MIPIYLIFYLMGFPIFIDTSLTNPVSYITSYLPTFPLKNIFLPTHKIYLVV